MARPGAQYFAAGTLQDAHHTVPSPSPRIVRQGPSMEHALHQV